ncbi:hypothetical protein AHU44_23625 [Salmonella enterica subsp. diarizonae]|nr:hypothetical protein [Salmonella enterica subsp. diarizonae]EDL8432137.1 hypothetical protein [Salmonella enterica subsp. diarizonae]EEI3023988.1 hypothetical protein [Salmonella enterica subsp. diarizonae]
MNVEGMLAEIDTNKRNVLHDGLLQKEKHPISVPLTGGGAISLSVGHTCQTAIFPVDSSILNPGYQRANLPCNSSFITTVLAFTFS